MSRSLLDSEHTSQKPTTWSPSPNATRGNHWGKGNWISPTIPGISWSLYFIYSKRGPLQCWWKTYTKQIEKNLEPRSFKKSQKLLTFYYSQKDTKQTWLLIYPYSSNCGMYTHLCTKGIKNMSIGEGNGNPLQYSCVKNLKDRWAWWASLGHCRVVHNLATEQQHTIRQIVIWGNSSWWKCDIKWRVKWSSNMENRVL